MQGRPPYGTRPGQGRGYGGTLSGSPVQDLQAPEQGGRFAGPLADEEGPGHPAPKRKRLNSFALLQVTLLPWGIFVGLFWVMSFFMHRDHPEASAFLVLCGLAISLGFMLKWFVRRNNTGDDVAELYSWFLYLAAASFVAWLAALVLGNANYTTNLHPYYKLSSTGLTRGVDPSRDRGNSYLDAGRVIFTEGTRIQEDMAMGYKDGSLYCVAPIVSGNGSASPLASYDFWAVGVDCCVPMSPTSFWCGDNVFDPTAHAGVRLSGDGGNFKHAIEMAEAQYGIAAKRPVFYRWTKDPVAETLKHRTAGIKFFHTCIWLYLAVQAVVFLALASCHWRLHAMGKLP